ncbi:MAG: phosphoribosylanthranilate isomerase [Candidatus Saelkia tenebricola]|nr:phosphoribosylanthranilate isomerase [Candidatus Saelkia tenebricola]
MVRIKFCGFTNTEDALAASRLGISAIGFVFAKTSPRYITPLKAAEIISHLAPFVLRVGVFLNSDIPEIEEIASVCKLDVIQLHGDEPPEFCRKVQGRYRCIKALRVKGEELLDIISEYNFLDAILLDSYKKNVAGGTGEIFDWDIARRARKFEIPIILSGGLNPDNIKKAIEEVNPYAVDISSGIESSPGIKDHELMAKFVASIWEEEWGL